MQNIECRMQNERRKSPARRFLALFCILNSAFCILSSCKSSAPATKPAATQPATITERQDAAMRDPFGYSPWKKDEKSRISGGGIGELDKDGMKRDMKSVFDP
jgi:hypothetical protein